MKRLLTFATMILGTILLSTPLVVAGGMGGGMDGGMGGGMMGNGGHMSDSYGSGHMGSGQQNNAYHNRDRVQERYRERQRVQEAYNSDMRQLDREIGSRQRDLKAERQKDAPDKAKIEKLRRELSNLEQRYDDRRAAFENKWSQDERP